MNKTILRIDASALKESACARRFYWNVVSGWRTAVNTNDIEFGSAVHEFIKVMRLNPGRYDMAIQAAQKRFSVPMTVKDTKKYLTPTYLTTTCLNFWQDWIEKDQFETCKAEDGTPLVELKFSYPYYADDQVEVLLCGTIDDICKHKHGTYALRDYKTTSVYRADDYLAGYNLSPQLLFYKMIVDFYGRTYPDSLFGEYSKRNIACMIDALFLKGASKPAEFKRSEVFVFEPTQVAEFERLVRQRIMNLVDYVKREVLPEREGMVNGACQTVYGPCKYFGACIQRDAVGTELMLKRHYVQVEYNPLAFDKQNEITK